MPARKTASGDVRRAAGTAAPAASVDALPGLASLFTLAQQVRSWTDSMVRMAGPATDLAVAVAGARTDDPKKRAAIHKAGAVLRRMRESAGMTVQDVAGALDLRDSELLESAESGAAALPVELILRLAAVLGRDDPLTAMMQLTRVYNPELWKTLEQLGIGQLVVQAGRERELANIYRANDQARRLDDADFARVVEFTRQAFDMAAAFSAKSRNAK
jgi:transcriptional regulator with XRE-family HTH domain